MGTVHIGEHTVGRRLTFRDRLDAGRRLVAWISPAPDPDALVFALPRGGVPVARPLADALGCPLYPVLVRKLPIPSDPEMGFGAVTIDGPVLLNEPVMRAFVIDQDVAERVTEYVRAELRRREAAYPDCWPLPDIADRHVWLVDDGLATGLTMLAALEMLRAHQPASIRVAVPCSPDESLAKVAPHADETFCMFVQTTHPFAVAGFYQDFHDLTDDEVCELLE